MVVAAAVAAALVGMAQPASAIETDPDPSANPCISGSTFSLTASRTSVVWGQQVTVTSSMNLAAGCTILPAATFIDFIDAQSGMGYDEPVGSTARATVLPPATGHYDLVVINGGHVYHVASTPTVTVTYPVVSGHPFARITANIPDEAATLEQAVQQANARVYIAGDVNLDMSEMDEIEIAPGVQIIGERSPAHPDGPRVFTQTVPFRLFDIGLENGTSPSDNVRVTGIEFDGMEPSDPCASAGLPEDEDAFTVWNSTGVEIDHDVFHSWNGAAVTVKKDNDDSDTDPVADRLTPAIGNAGVWVYDNYIHDNQHPTVCSDIDPLASDGHGAGYGVDTSYGGYAYVQGNVFDSNRHSITGDGRDGSGYILTGNLFFRPGVDDVKIITNYNHLIDMHGTNTCDSTFTKESYNCGQGGLYMEVENNTVVGATGTPAATIQLRGKPTNVSTPTPGVSNSYGMYVHDNVINDTSDHALTETQDDNGLFVGPGNFFEPTATSQAEFALAFNEPSSQGPFCDFDGDGTADAFRNDAGVFWYYSSLTGRWEYLATPNVPSTNLAFGDVNGDGLCDVSNASGVVYKSSPIVDSFPLPATMPYVDGMPQSAAQDAIAAAGLQLGTVYSVLSTIPAGTVLAQNPIAGAAAQAGSPSSLTVSAGGTLLPNVTGMTQANAQAALNAAGLVVGSIIQANSSAPVGTVYTESPTPGPGVLVPPGSTVAFGISLGPLVLVPDILGDTEAEANQAIAGVGLTLGKISSTASCIDTGTVQVQDPIGGARVSPGSAMTYTLSTCPSGGGGGGSGGGGGTGGGGGGGGKPPILPK